MKISTVRHLLALGAFLCFFSAWAQPTVTPANISITSTPTGAGGTVYIVGNTVTAQWNNTAGGENQPGVTGVDFDFTEFGGGIVVGVNTADVWEASYIIGTGTIDVTNADVLVQATDGVGSSGFVSDDLNVSVDNEIPVVSATNISIVSSGTGTGGVFIVGDDIEVEWDAIADGNMDIFSVTIDFSAFGGGAAVVASESGGVWSATYTLVAGTIDATNLNVSVTATDDADNATTQSGTDNVSVDNEIPVVTATNISIVSSGTGTGGVFIVGDDIDVEWDATADGNSDIFSVTIDFSAFGGGAAVVASESGGVWSATYTLVAGTIDATNLNVSVTATDDADNATTQSGTDNVSVDNESPVVTAGNISITSSGSGAGGVFVAGDAIEVEWDGAADGNSDIFSVTIDFSAFGGGAAVAATEAAGIWSASYVLVSGTIDDTDLNVSVTATDDADNETIQVGTDNVSVDVQTPTLTSANIEITSTGLGAGGVYIIDNEVIVQWDNSAAGDNNADIFSVSMNFSSFGGPVSVAATNMGGDIWEASYTIVDGTIDATNLYVGVTVTDDAGIGINTSSSNFGTLDNERPTVADIFRNLPAGTPTNADAVVFYVNFSETVTNVTDNDFTITGTASGDGAIGTVASVDGDTWSVQITGLTNSNGTIGLDPAANGGLTDSPGNEMTSTIVSGTEESYTIDNVGPDLTSITRQTPSTSTTNANSLTWRFTFTQAVSNLSLDDFDVTGTTATVSNISDQTNGVFDVTVSGGDLATLNDLVTITLNVSDITDVAGNPLSAGTPTGTNDNTYLVDNTAPDLTSITRQTPATSPTNADALIWRLTFTQAVSNLSADDFGVTGTTATVTNIADQTGGVYDVTLSGGDLAGLNATASITLSISDITDLAGNALSSGTPTGTNDNSYVVDNTAPQVSSIVRQSPTTSPTNADELVWEVTINGAVVNVDATDFSVTGTTATVASAIDQGGNVYRVTVNGGNLASLNATVTLSLAGNDITDAAGNALNTTVSGTNDNTYVVDNTAPDLTSITRQTPATSPTNADALVWRFTFTQVVSNLSADDFNVTGTTATVTNIADQTGGVYDITVSGGDLAALNATVTITLNVSNITDLAGNALSAGTPTGTNINTYLVDNTAPTISSFTLEGSNSYVDVTFSSPVYNASAGALIASAFTITGFTNNGTAGATAVSIADITTTADAPLAGGETVIRFVLSITGTPDTNDQFAIQPASASSVYDLAGNAMLGTQTTGTITLNEILLANTVQFVSALPAPDNSYIIIEFNNVVDRTSGVGTGAIRYRANASEELDDADYNDPDANTTFTISTGSVSLTDAAGAAQAAGTVWRLPISVGGTAAAGNETFRIFPADGAEIYYGTTAMASDRTITVTLADKTAHSFNSATAIAYDDNANGNIDRVRVTLPDAIDDATVTLSNFTFGGVNPTSMTTGTANDNVIDLNFTTYTGTTVGVSLTYTAGTLRDNARFGMYGGVTADGNLFTTGSCTPTDAASPVVTAAYTRDIDADGQIDRVDIVYSENLVAIGALANSDITIAGYTVTGVAISTNEFRATITESGSSDTGATPNVSVAVSSVEDAAGNDNAAYGATAASDGAAPALISTTPADNATSINRTTNLTLNWSENAVVGTGNISLIDTNNASGNQTFDVTSSVTGSGTSTWTINPADMEYFETYAVQIAATAVDDALGNSYAGISNNTTWNFQTAGQIPTITAARWLDVNLDGNIDRVRLTFDTNVNVNDAGNAGDGFDALSFSAGTVVNAEYDATNVSQLNLDLSGITGTVSPAITITYNTAGSSTIVANLGLEEMANGTTPNAYQDGAAPYSTVNGGVQLVTSDLSPLITGAINDPTAVILINIGSSTAAAMNNGDGSWTLPDNTITVSGPGIYNVTTISIDAFGNTSAVVHSNALNVPAGVQITAPVFDECIGSGYVTLGTIEITESGDNAGISTGGTLNLLLPAGFEFNTAVTPNTIGSTLTDVSGVSFSYASSTVLTVNITLTGTVALDEILINGLEIRAVGSTAYSNVSMTRVGGTAGINTLDTEYADLSSQAVEPALTDVLLNGVTSVTNHITRFVSTVTVNYTATAGVFVDGEILTIGNTTAQMVPGSDDGTSFRVYLLTGVSFSDTNLITGQSSGKTANVSGTPVSAADYLLPFTLVANPGGHTAVWYDVASGTPINVGDVQQTTADQTELGTVSAGLYSFDVTIDNGTCENEPLRVKVLVLEDLDNEPLFGTNTFADRSFVVTSGVDTLFLSQPANHTVSVSGAGITLTNPSAADLVIYFDPELVGVGSYPITMTVTNTITGDQLTRVVTYTVVPEDAFFDPDLTEFCIDDLPLTLELRDPTWWISNPGAYQEYYFDNWLNTNLPACCGLDYTAAYGYFYFYNQGVENLNTNYGNYEFPFDPRTWNTVQHGGFGFGDPFDVPDGQVYTIYVQRYREKYAPVYEFSIERDYFQVYGTPIVSLNNLTGAYCADDASFTLNRKASYATGMSPLNPNDPYSYWTPSLVVDEVLDISTGYQLWTESTPGSGVYDMLYVDFTASGSGINNVLNPQDLDQDGDDYTIEDESGNYRIIYVSEPLTPVGCSTTVMYDFTLSPQPALPVLSATTVSQGGNSPFINSDEYLLEFCQNYTASGYTLPGGGLLSVSASISGWTGPAFTDFTYFFAYNSLGQYVGYGYLFADDTPANITFDTNYYFANLDLGSTMYIYNSNVGFYEPTTVTSFNRVITPADVTWYDEDLNPIPALENLSYVSPADIGLNASFGYYGADETIEFYFSTTSVDGCESELRKVTVDVHAYPSAPNITLPQGGFTSLVKSGDFYTLDYCVPEGGMLTPGSLTLDPLTGTNSKYRVQQHRIVDPSRGVNGYIYSLALNSTAGFQLGETVSGQSFGGSAIIYGIVGNSLRVATNNYFANGETVQGQTSMASGVMQRDYEFGYDLNGTTLPQLTLFSTPGNNSFQEIGISKVENDNLSSDFNGCSGNYAWLNIYGWTDPSAPTLADFPTITSLDLHICEGETFSAINNFSDGTNQYVWYGSDGTTEIARINNGLSMASATLEPTPFYDKDVAGVYTFYVSKVANVNTNRGFVGCEGSQVQVTISVHPIADEPTVSSLDYLDENMDPVNVDYYVCVSDYDPLGTISATSMYSSSFGTEKEFLWYSADAGGISQTLLYTGTDPTFTDLNMGVIGGAVIRYFNVFQRTDDSYFVDGTGCTSPPTFLTVEFRVAEDYYFKVDPVPSVAPFTVLTSGAEFCHDEASFVIRPSTTSGSGTDDFIADGLYTYTLYLGGTSTIVQVGGFDVTGNTPLTMDLDAFHYAAGGLATGGGSTTFDLEYVYADPVAECTRTKVFSFTIHPQPEATYLIEGLDYEHDPSVNGGAPIEVCFDDGILDLEGMFHDPGVLLAPLSNLTGNLFSTTAPGGTIVNLGSNKGTFDISAAHDEDPFKLETSYPVAFNYTDLEGCDTTVYKTIIVKPRPSATGTIGTNQIKFYDICKSSVTYAYIEMLDPADGVTPVTNYAGYTFNWEVNGASYNTVAGGPNMPGKFQNSNYFFLDVNTLNFKVTVTNPDGCSVTITETHTKQDVPTLNFPEIAGTQEEYCSEIVNNPFYAPLQLTVHDTYDPVGVGGSLDPVGLVDPANIVQWTVVSFNATTNMFAPGFPAQDADGGSFPVLDLEFLHENAGGNAFADYGGVRKSVGGDATVHIITVQYRDQTRDYQGNLTECLATYEERIRIEPSTDIDIAVNFLDDTNGSYEDHFCYDNGLVALNGIFNIDNTGLGFGQSGTWSGPGVTQQTQTSATWNPIIANGNNPYAYNPAGVVVTFTYVNSDGCSQTVTKTLYVDPLPDPVEFFGPQQIEFLEICAGSPIVARVRVDDPSLGGVQDVDYSNYTFTWNLPGDASGAVYLDNQVTYNSNITNATPNKNFTIGVIITNNLTGCDIFVQETHTQQTLPILTFNGIANGNQYCQEDTDVQFTMTTNAGVIGVAGATDIANLDYSVHSYRSDLGFASGSVIASGSGTNPTIDMDQWHLDAGGAALGGYHTIHVITMTYEDLTDNQYQGVNTNCISTATATISIYPDADLSFTVGGTDRSDGAFVGSLTAGDLSADDFCYDDASVNLVGIFGPLTSALGYNIALGTGSFSSTTPGAVSALGNNAALFNPAAAHNSFHGGGLNPHASRSAHTVTYTFLDQYSCENSVSTVLYVNPLPNPIEVASGSEAGDQIHFSEICVQSPITAFVPLLDPDTGLEVANYSDYTFTWTLPFGSSGISQNLNEVTYTSTKLNADGNKTFTIGVTVTNNLTGCDFTISEVHEEQALPILSFNGIANGNQYCQEDTDVQFSMITDAGEIGVAGATSIANLDYSVYSYRSDLGFASGSVIASGSGINPTIDMDQWHLDADGTLVGGYHTIHVITMMYADLTDNLYQLANTNCISTATATITIYPDTDLSYTVTKNSVAVDRTDGAFVGNVSAGDLSNDDYCYDDGSVPLIGIFGPLTAGLGYNNGLGTHTFTSTTPGAVVSTGNNTAIFRPSIAHNAYHNAANSTVGLNYPYAARSAHTVTYTYTDQFGCSNAVDAILYVNPRPEPVVAAGNGSIVFDALCLGWTKDARIELVGVTDYSDYTFNWVLPATSVSAGSTTDPITNQVLVSKVGDNTVQFEQDNLIFSLSVTVTNNLTGCSITITESETQGYSPVPTFTYVGITENAAAGLDVNLFQDNPLLNNNTLTFLRFELRDLSNNVVAFIERTGSGNAAFDLSPMNFTGLAAGEYRASLTMQTIKGCSITNDQMAVTNPQVLPFVPDPPNYRTMTILPVVDLGDPIGGGGYLKDFADLDGWYIERASENGKSDTRVSSWQLNGGTVSTTGNLGTYYPGEVSFVYSPAFDMDQYTNAAIRFDYLRNFDSNRDGLVVQVSDDDGRTWMTLGDNNINSGINWYSHQGISAGPGASVGRAPETGTNPVLVGFSDVDLVNEVRTPTLKEARHQMAIGNYQTPGTKIRFRFAFSALNSNKANAATTGFSFDNFRIYEINKLMLVEQFATTLSAESKRTEEFIETGLVDGGGTDHHAFDWDGGNQGLWINYFTDMYNDGAIVDPINARNKVDPATRATFYGLTDVPETRIAGQTVSYDLDDNPEDFVNAFNALSLQDADFQINKNHPSLPDDIVINASDANTISVSATFRPLIDVSEVEAGFFFAVVEKVKPNVTSGVYSGESIPYVLRVLVPGPAGHYYRGPLVAGQIEPEMQIDLDWTISAIDDPDNIRVIAFVQYFNHPNPLKIGSVEQAAFVDFNGLGKDNVVTGLEDLLNKDVLTVYPNPANARVSMRLADAPLKPVYWRMSDQSGREVKIGRIERGIKEVTIDTQDLPSGMYIIQIFNDEGSWVPKKVVIQH